MGFLALQTIKAALSIADNAADEQLGFFLAAAESVIESYCNRRFGRQTLTEFYSGNGTYALILRQRPVRTVFDVRQDDAGYFGSPAGSFGDLTRLIEGVDWQLDYDGAFPANGQRRSTSGLLFRLRTTWRERERIFRPFALTNEVGPAFGNVRVQYDAGYDAAELPADLQLAAATLVGWTRRSIKLGGAVKSEMIGDYRYIMHNALKYPELGTVAQVLTRYREPSF